TVCVKRSARGRLTAWCFTPTSGPNVQRRVSIKVANTVDTKTCPGSLFLKNCFLVLVGSLPQKEDLRMFSTFKSIMLIVSLVIAVLGTAPGVAFAGPQSVDGTLRGEVTDPSGAVVANAKVTATNIATNVSVDTTTSAAGTFNLPNLLPG